MNTTSASPPLPSSGRLGQQQGAAGLHPAAPDYTAWRKPALRAELKRLEHRKVFTILSAKVRREEDAQIDAIIAELRRREGE